jgi:hypothetical protein
MVIYGNHGMVGERHLLSNNYGVGLVGRIEFCLAISGEAFFHCISFGVR